MIWYKTLIYFFACALSISAHALATSTAAPELTNYNVIVSHKSAQVHLSVANNFTNISFGGALYSLSCNTEDKTTVKFNILFSSDDDIQGIIKNTMPELSLEIVSMSAPLAPTQIWQAHLTIPLNQSIRIVKCSAPNLRSVW